MDQQEPLLAQATSFEVGERVVVIPRLRNDIVRNEFMGVVIGIKDGRYVQVKDQEDNVFDCEPVQVHHCQ